MKILIIYAHPDTRPSFCFNTLDRVQKILREKNVEFEVLDLYKMEYDPVLKASEHYTAGHREISLQNQEIQKKIKDSQALIFIYPTWWGSMPAIMKGFMDRVFTPGFAFRYRQDKLFKFIPDQLLNDKKMSIITTMGGPGFVYRLILNPVKTINDFVVYGLFTSKSKTFQIFEAHGEITEKRNREIQHIADLAVRWIAK